MPVETLTAIKPELLFLLPILYTVGEIIKKSSLKNWLIPPILWGVSVFLATMYLLSVKQDAGSVYLGIVQGTIIAFTTVGGNQLIKQVTEKRLIDNAESISFNYDKEKEKNSEDKKNGT